MESLPEYSDIAPVHSRYNTDLVQGIGEFFLACAAAETALLFLLQRVQSYPHKSRAINAIIPLLGMQNKVMLEKITTTSMAISPSLGIKVGKLATKIRRIFEHRNMIAHNVAILGFGDTIKVSEMKLTETGKGGKEMAYKVADLRQHSDNLYRLVRHVSEVLKAHNVRGVQTLDEQDHPAQEDQ